MAKIISNERLSKDFFLMKVEEENHAVMGQFYMLRAWGSKSGSSLSSAVTVYCLSPSVTLT